MLLRSSNFTLGNRDQNSHLKIHTTVLIDCRWIDSTGLGRVTSLLLEGLQEIAPPGSWILWGPDKVKDFLWKNAQWKANNYSAMAWAGQRETLKVPKADTVLFLHAVRPIFRRNGQDNIVFFHDTIPIRWDERWERRITWRVFFTVSARFADKILVQSSATKRHIQRDLGASVDHVLSLPSDSKRAMHIRALRAELTVDPLTMLYVGRVRPHKNIIRALMAFASSDFKRMGGKFVLVGADQHGQDSIKDTLRQINSDQITVVPRCSDEELDRIYATAGFLIQPSLEEGYGLPIIEALNVGMPVCCSDIEPMSEVAKGQAELFDPWSIFSMSKAIDRTANNAREGITPDPPQTPTPREFAEEILSVLNAT